jgi:thiol-disulfide isomerase/thioredoxin
LNKHFVWTAVLAVAPILLIPLSLAAAVKAGDTPPDYLGKDEISGNAVNLSAYKGKVVVATFWATWCGYCMKELPILERMQGAAGTGSLQVVAVNFHEEDQKYNKVRSAFKQSPMILTYDLDSQISKSYGVKGLPNMFIIDKQGKVAYHHLGYDEDMLDTIVSELNGLFAQ